MRCPSVLELLDRWILAIQLYEFCTNREARKGEDTSNKTPTGTKKAKKCVQKLRVQHIYTLVDL